MVVASPKVWFVGAWQFQLNQIEATASKSAKTTLRHRAKYFDWAAALLEAVVGCQSRLRLPPSWPSKSGRIAGT
jgi:hypothetical protein